MDARATLAVPGATQGGAVGAAHAADALVTDTSVLRRAADAAAAACPQAIRLPPGVCAAAVVGVAAQGVVAGWAEAVKAKAV